MDDFREIENYEEEEVKEKPLWKRLLIIGIALVVLFSVFYIYGGLRQFFFYRETPAGMSQVPTEVKVEGEVMSLPLKVLVFRSEAEGSQRSMESIESLVKNASEVWRQGAINFEISSIKEMEVSESEIDLFLDDPPGFIRNTEEYSREMVNVVLVRRLKGINGIAFPGTKILSVADLTTVYDFRVLAHEIGHILGLGHVSGKSRLMHREANGFEITLEEIKKARESGLFD